MTRRLLILVAVTGLLSAGLAVAQEKKAGAPSPTPAQQESIGNPAPEAPPPPRAQRESKKSGGAQRELVEASEAAAGEDESAQFKRSPSVRWVAGVTGLNLVSAYWLCIALNFAVIAIAIAVAMKKLLPGAFRDRTANIQKALEEARKASEDANRRLSDIEGRLAKLDHEIAAMRAGAEQEGRAEEERIRAATEDERQKVVETAQQEIAAAARSARHELKAYVAELAVSIAEQKIQIGQNEDRELVRTFADRLGKDGR